MPYSGQHIKAKSASQLKAEGRHIKHGEASNRENPKPLGPPQVPAWFDEDEVRLWGEVLRSMPDGIMTSADNLVLEKLVTQAIFARRCSALIAEQGFVIEGPNKMYQKHPLIASRHAALNSVQSACETLGLTPTARNRLAAPPKPEEELPDDLFHTSAPMTAPLSVSLST